MSIQNKRIIHANENGGIAVTAPSVNWDQTMEELAEKILPEGEPYAIIDVSDLPTDRQHRDLWRFDFNDPQRGIYIAPETDIPAITARQFLAALAIAGFITVEEALDRTALPAAIDAVFSTLPTAQQIVARVTWANMTVVARDEPLVAAVVAAGFTNPATGNPVTESEVDNLFLLAATL